MKISTKGRHAVTAMMELALHDKDGPVTLAEISQAQAISVSYLEQLFARLRLAGLVSGMRGPGGGYRLHRSSSEISIAQILSAIDDKVRMTPNINGDIDAENESRNDGSLFLWEQLSNRIYDYLDSISLADVVEMDPKTDGGPNSNNGPPAGFQRSAA